METFFKNKELNEAMGSKAVSTSKGFVARKQQVVAHKQQFQKYDCDGIEERLCKAIVEHREKNGLSKADLSKNSGVNRSIITRLETGTVPSLVNLLQICNALELDIDELLRGEK